MSDISQAVAAALRSREQGRPDGRWDEDAGREVTARIEADGWLRVGLPEALGGEGGELGDLLEVVDAVATAGWPSPVPDFLLATALQRALRIALEPPVGRVVVVRETETADAGDRVSVCAAAVGWTNWATHLLVVGAAGAGTRLSYVPTAGLAVRSGRGLDGAPAAAVDLADAPAEHTIVVDRPVGEVESLILCGGALIRSVQTVAAIRRAEALTVDYSGKRRQFGRELVKFQAVQQQLALLAAESAAAQAAVRQAVDNTKELDDLLGDSRLAVAKCRSALAGSEVARISHQLHGAIGTTTEYELHRHTTALWAWRDEFGSEFFWSEQLARSAARDADVWAWIAAESEA